MTDKRKYAYFVVEGYHDAALVMRVPVPTFYQSDTLSIAIHVATSDSLLVTMLNGSLGNMEMRLLQAFGHLQEQGKLSGCIAYILSEVLSNIEYHNFRKHGILLSVQIDNDNYDWEEVN